MWQEWLMVGLGGFLGSMSRYGVTLLSRHWAHAAVGTFLVNVGGCFLIGLLMSGELGQKSPIAWRLALEVGFLGAFTTFSAFGLQTLHLYQINGWQMALGNICANLLGGLLAVWVALRLV